MLKQRSDEQLTRWEQVVKTDIAGFNQLVRQQDVPTIILDTNSAASAAASSGGAEEESRKN
jgi:hypothetical protein